MPGHGPAASLSPPRLASSNSVHAFMPRFAAPRFSATPGAIQRLDPAIGAHNESGLASWGFAEPDIAALKSAGAL